MVELLGLQGCRHNTQRNHASQPPSIGGAPAAARARILREKRLTLDVEPAPSPGRADGAELQTRVSQAMLRFFVAGIESRGTVGDALRRTVSVELKCGNPHGYWCFERSGLASVGCIHKPAHDRALGFR